MLSCSLQPTRLNMRGKFKAGLTSSKCREGKCQMMICSKNISCSHKLAAQPDTLKEKIHALPGQPPLFQTRYVPLRANANPFISGGIHP